MGPDGYYSSSCGRILVILTLQFYMYRYKFDSKNSSFISATFYLIDTFKNCFVTYLNFVTRCFVLLSYIRYKYSYMEEMVGAIDQARQVS